MPPTTPLNIAAAALWSQFAYTFAVAVAYGLSERPEHFTNYERRGSAALVVALGCCGIGAILLAEDIAQIAARLFEGLPAPSLSTSAAVTASLWTDALFVSLLMRRFGSSAEAFTPFLLVVPTLAIFLRASTLAIWSLSGYAALVVWTTRERRRSSADAVLATLSTLVIATALGWVTRPR